jgi:hypothetical protein
MRLLGHGGWARGWATGARSDRIWAALVLLTTGWPKAWRGGGVPSRACGGQEGRSQKIPARIEKRKRNRPATTFPEERKALPAPSGDGEAREAEEGGQKRRRRLGFPPESPKEGDAGVASSPLV